MDSFINICWTSPFTILVGLVFFVTFILHVFLMENAVLANNVDTNQMPHYVASDLGLYCLPMTLLRVSS